MRSHVKLWIRPQYYPLWTRVRRRLLSGRQDDFLLEIEKFLNTVTPKLVIFSTAANLPTIEWLELCHRKGLPFVTVAHNNSDVLVAG